MACNPTHRPLISPALQPIHLGPSTYIYEPLPPRPPYSTFLCSTSTERWVDDFVTQLFLNCGQGLNHCSEGNSGTCSRTFKFESNDDMCNDYIINYFRDRSNECKSNATLHARMRCDNYYIGKNTATNKTLGTLAPLNRHFLPFPLHPDNNRQGKDLDRMHS